MPRTTIQRWTAGERAAIETTSTSNLMLLRRLNGETVSEIAYKTNLTIKDVCNLEAGIDSVRADKTMAVVALFGKPLKTLLAAPSRKPLI